MKTKKLFPRHGVASRKAWACRVLPALLAALNLISVGQAPAQTFASLGNLYGSEAYFDNPILLGNTLYASLHGLVLSGNTFFGTSFGDYETHNSGGVYAVNFDGTGYNYTSLHAFTPLPTYAPFINADGAFPYAGLILSGPTLYGTTKRGGYGDGTYGEGTLFAVSTNGTGFTNLHNYGSADGGYPEAGSFLSSNIPYGTTAYGGSAGSGTVFAANTNGTGFSVLHSFTATHTNAFGVSTNSDGAYPQAELVLSGNTLYGTALYGGSAGNGTVFSVNTNGTGFTNLHSFPAGPHPEARLILSGNSLYGTTAYSGSAGAGTVFAVNSSGFTTLHSFTATQTNAFGVSTNSDGASPEGLILLGNTLYGTAFRGGSSGRGTVFTVSTNGTGLSVLHSFTATYPFYPYLFSDAIFTNRDGAFPQAGLNLSGNALYGTTAGGGSLGSGTVFSISFQPQLTITPSGPNIILSWPTDVAGFDSTGYTLQSTTNLDSPFWSTNSPAPVVIVGQNTVTNPITGAQQFYRLIR